MDHEGSDTMLFRKKIPVDCTYCVHSASAMDDGQFLCAKKGLTEPRTKCAAFRYAPTKRIPPKPKAPDFSKYEQEDFSL